MPLITIRAPRVINRIETTAMAKPAHKFDPPPPQTPGERIVAIETVVPALAKREDVATLTGKMNTRFERVDAAIERVDGAIGRVEKQLKSKADKADVKEVERSIKADVKELKSDVKLELVNQRRESDKREAVRTRWEAGILVAIVGLMAAVLFRLGPFGD